MRCFSLLLFIALNGKGLSQTTIPHPVPEEFGSDYYEVLVNGQSVPVFHARLNVYFVSFYFIGTVKVNVKSNFNSNSYSGQTFNKEAVIVDEKGYWGGEAFVRPLSKGIKPQLNGLTVTFSVSEAGQYSVERP